MDEETNKIRKHIDAERDELGRNLDEIEHRVKSATDIKAHFNRNTGLILGAAVAGGFLLSLIFRNSSNSDSQGGGSASTRERNTNSTAPAMHPGSRHLRRFSETLDTIFDGLVGVATGKLQSFVADAVPGFQAQYDAIDRQSDRSSVHQMRPDLGNHGEFSAAK